MRELFIYCDESIADGRYYSNFYGGILIESAHLKEVNERLAATKESLNLFGELKWQKISAAYAEKYRLFVDEVFTLVSERKLKIRIMFRQNNWLPRNLSAEQVENEYFMLYYQFIKHAFGLAYIKHDEQSLNVRLLFDKLPDTREKSEAFKGQLLGLNRSSPFVASRLRIRHDQISEVDSKDHDPLQALDIILGAIQFRLNDKHLDKPEGSKRRGKRTIAKESVYKHINARIRELRPGFNIGTNTSDLGISENRWNDVYRHWSFVPRERDQNPNYKKKGSATAK